MGASSSSITVPPPSFQTYSSLQYNPNHTTGKKGGKGRGCRRGTAMHIYIYTHIHIYMNTYIRTYIYIYVRIYTYTSICMYISRSRCRSMSMLILIFILVVMSACINMCGWALTEPLHESPGAPGAEDPDRFPCGGGAEDLRGPRGPPESFEGVLAGRIRIWRSNLLKGSAIWRCP